MDQPLFGEQKQGTAVFQAVIGFVVVAFTIVTLVSGAIKGIHDTKLFALVAALILIFVNLAILTKWYRDKDDRLAPKFSYLMITLVLAVLLMCAAAQPFIWYKPPPAPQWPLCPGGLQTQGTDPTDPTKYTYSCYSVSGVPLDQCIASPGQYCLQFQGSYFSCGNCTTTPPSLEDVAETQTFHLLNN